MSVFDDAIMHEAYDDHTPAFSFDSELLTPLPSSPTGLEWSPSHTSPDDERGLNSQGGLGDATEMFVNASDENMVNAEEKVTRGGDSGADLILAVFLSGVDPRSFNIDNNTPSANMYEETPSASARETAGDLSCQQAPTPPARPHAPSPSQSQPVQNKQKVSGRRSKEAHASMSAKRQRLGQEGAVGRSEVESLQAKKLLEATSQCFDHVELVETFECVDNVERLYQELRCVVREERMDELVRTWNQVLGESYSQKTTEKTEGREPDNAEYRSLQLHYYLRGIKYNWREEWGARPDKNGYSYQKSVTAALDRAGIQLQVPGMEAGQKLWGRLKTMQGPRKFVVRGYDTNGKALKNGAAFEALCARYRAKEEEDAGLPQVQREDSLLGLVDDADLESLFKI